MQVLLSLISGGVFGAGLALSGMMNPTKVLNFLDFTGTWDPTLAVVMASALLVSFLGFQVASKKKKPVFGDKFGIPTRKDIDKPLVIGSAFFGLGWGLVGFCPGPALSALSTGMAEPLIFTAAMVAGMAAHKALKLP